MPGGLQACGESRFLLASLGYTQAFRPRRQERHIWVNFAIDTILAYDFHVRSLRAERTRIRHLEADFQLRSPAHPLWQPEVYQHVDQMRALESIGMVMPQLPGWNDCMNEVAAPKLSF